MKTVELYAKVPRAVMVEEKSAKWRGSSGSSASDRWQG